jgi:hypothetical protein
MLLQPRPQRNDQFDDFEIVALSEQHEAALYKLIQEQEEELNPIDSREGVDFSSKSWTLFQSVVHSKGAEAFLVVRRSTGTPLTAVTFYDCITDRGRGIYLEDIVTTRSERSNGAGEFAMIGLAQIAMQRDAKAAVWECAQSKNRAHRFYDRFECERYQDRHTWRMMGRVQPSQHHNLFNELYNVSHERGFKDAQHWLTHDVDCDHPHLIALTARHKVGDVHGAVLANRSYSTFRVVNGIQIKAVHVSHDDALLVAGMLEHLGHLQQLKGWSGHVDLTVMDSQRAFLEPIIRPYGFEPLAYSHDPMVVRGIYGQKLHALANRVDTSIIGNLVQGPHSPGSVLIDATTKSGLFL